MTFQKAYVEAFNDRLCTIRRQAWLPGWQLTPYSFNREEWRHARNFVVGATVHKLAPNVFWYATLKDFIATDWYIVSEFNENYPALVTPDNPPRPPHPR